MRGQAQLSIAMRITTREKTRARRAAHRIRHPRGFKTHAFVGEPIQVRRARVGVAVAAEFRAVVLGDDQKHVGLSAARLLFWRGGGLADVRELYALEGHVGAAAFVEDADGLVVDHREAGVAAAATRIEQQP